MLGAARISTHPDVHTSRPWWTLATLSLSLLIITMDNTILNVALPTIQQEFDASASSLQWMVDAYLLAFAGLLLTMGALGDRFGRSRALNAGLVIFAAASVAATIAETPAQLIVVRGAMGVGGALIMPSTLSILTDVFEGPARARAIAVWTAVGGIGVSIGPLVGGALLERFAWPAVFLVNVPVALVALTAGTVLVPSTRNTRPRRVDIPGAALSTAAVSAFVYGVIEAPARGWMDDVVVGAFFAATALAVAFLAWERVTGEPMLELSFIANWQFTAGLIAISVGFFALVGIVYGMTQYLQFVLGYSPLEAGAALLPVGAGVGAGSRIGQRVASRRGAPVVMCSGLILLATSLAAAGLFGASTKYAFIGIDFFFVALAMGLIFAPATERVMSSVPAHSAGVASAMNDVARQVGGALGVAILGSVLNATYTREADDAMASIPRIPADDASTAADSIGAATEIASSLPPSVGGLLLDASRGAFVDALAVEAIAAAAVALAGAAVVGLALWRRGEEANLP